MHIEPEVLLNDLKEGRHTRTQQSLEKLNSLLKERFESGEKDFCIATIGRVSSGQGGVSTNSIRNKPGECYRRLIEA